MRRSRRSTTTSAVLAAALAIPLVLGDCTLESAVVDVVSRDAVRVVATLQCGPRVCFERWIDVAGQRRGVSRACEAWQGTGLYVEPSEPKK